MTPPFERRRLKIIATGGTIAGAQTGADSMSYRAGVLSLEALLSAVPRLGDFAELELEQIMSLGSQDMDTAAWLTLRASVAAALARPEIDGVVVTHGTDTLEESAFFLDLTLDSAKPVVLVGAMRPATAISPDGPMNLFNAVSVASHPDACNRGVLVVANDEVHFARDVTKTSTTQVGTFSSGPRGLAGWVSFGTPHLFENRQHRPPALTWTFNPEIPLPRVEIIYGYAGLDELPFLSAVQNGAKGIVVAGVGAGNLSRAARHGAAEALSHGVTIVRSTRVGTGKVERNTELNDDQLGTLTSGDLNPQKARIALQLALQGGAKGDEIQHILMNI